MFCFSGSNPCKKNLNDREFLEHMIAHHQVAIDVSYRMLKFTNDPTISHLCRNITWSQKNQIMGMKMLWDFPMSFITNNNNKTTADHSHCNPIYPFKYYYPNTSADCNAKCSIMFFDPNEEHLSHVSSLNTHNPKPSSKDIKKRYLHIWNKLLDPISSTCSSNDNPITDVQFMKHMIEHHQIAVNMCNNLLKNTQNTTMMAFAGEIIRAQQYEIWYMNNLLKGFYRHKSENLYSIDKQCMSCNDSFCRKFF